MHEGIDFSDFLKAVGLAIRKVRVREGFTQAQLAQKTGKTQSAIAKIERSSSLDIPLRLIFEVATAIPVSISELLALAEKECSMELASGSRRTQVTKRLGMLPKEQRQSIEIILQEILGMVPSSTGDNLRQGSR